MRYLRELVMPHPVHKVLLEETLKAVDEAGERVARLTELIEAQYLEWERRDWCEALMGLRGFGVLTAVSMVAEIGGPVLRRLSTVKSAGSIRFYAGPRTYFALRDSFRRRFASGAPAFVPRTSVGIRLQNCWAIAFVIHSPAVVFTAR